MKTRAKKQRRALAVNATKGVARKNRAVRAKKKVYTLKELLRGVTKFNLHPEIDWGPPVGKEVW